ncbi:unnamed protein product [Calicophoron daubneyi]|uniref:Centrosomal protein of 78 kDa n=1 Tax=Calicophoron daubneyi TaxID=300641 RepID=A0AAV2SYF5_CALDB
MIPTVKERQKGAYDFRGFYENLCALQNLAPLQLVTCHVHEGILDLNADRIRINDWDPIIKSLRINRNLHFIAIRVFPESGNEKDDHLIGCRRNPPALLAAPSILRSVCQALQSTLAVTSKLIFLELQNIPLPILELSLICEGLVKNHTLKHLSFEGSKIGDKGLAELCRAMKKAPEVSTLNLTGCDITSRGIDHLTSLIRFQATQRHNAAWQESLRYRIPALDQLGGLRRITLNDNPELGDSGSISIAETLMDDLWVKAIDMQACNLSDSSARVWLQVLLGEGKNANGEVAKHNNGNRSLFVLDLRRNPRICRELLRAVTERALVNSEGKQTEYKWLRAGPRAPTRLCSGMVAYTWPGVGHVESVDGNTNGNHYSSRVQNYQMREFPLRRSRSHRSVSSVRRPCANGDGSFGSRSARKSSSTSAHGRFRSLSARSSRHSRESLVHRRTKSISKSLNSPPISARAVWRPPGAAHHIEAVPYSEPASRTPRKGTGIPWRTAARASRCCRGYPYNQHPGQTCLEAHAVKLEQQVNQTIMGKQKNQNDHQIRVHPFDSSRYSCFRTASSPYSPPEERRAQKRLSSNSDYSAKSTQPQLRRQVKKLATRVVQLEAQLHKERRKHLMAHRHQVAQTNGRNRNMTRDQTRNSTGSSRLDQLDCFVRHLQRVVANVQHLSTEDEHKEIKELNKNIKRLCELLSHTAKQPIVWESNDGHQTVNSKSPSNPCSGHMAQSKFTPDAQSTNVNQTAGSGRNPHGKMLSTCPPNIPTAPYWQGKSLVQSDTDSKKQSPIYWETRVKTRAIQTNANRNANNSHEQTTNGYGPEDDTILGESPSLHGEAVDQTNARHQNSLPKCDKLVTAVGFPAGGAASFGDGPETRVSGSVSGVRTLTDGREDTTLDVDAEDSATLRAEADQMYAEIKASTFVENATHEQQSKVNTLVNGGVPMRGGGQADGTSTAGVGTEGKSDLHPHVDPKHEECEGDFSDEEVISDEEESLNMWIQSKASQMKAQVTDSHKVINGKPGADMEDHLSLHFSTTDEEDNGVSDGSDAQFEEMLAEMADEETEDNESVHFVELSDMNVDINAALPLQSALIGQAVPKPVVSSGT